MSGVIQATVLGCGSSGGVPRADGRWGACDPSEPRNRRSRCSLLVRRKASIPGAEETTVLVDTAPELRLQTSSAGATRMDAVLLTHDHADQTHGLDDLRAFFLSSKYRKTPVYMDDFTEKHLMRRFGYVFAGEGGYPAVCEARALPPHGVQWSVEGPSGAVPILGFDQDHGAIRSVGFRFGPIAYSSDVVGLPEESFAALAGVQVWIVDALRVTPHPTHAHVDMTLDWIARVGPERAILTNMTQELDYRSLAASLPPGVEPAYDGMVIEADL